MLLENVEIHTNFVIFFGQLVFAKDHLLIFDELPFLVRFGERPEKFT